MGNYNISKQIHLDSGPDGWMDRNNFMRTGSYQISFLKIKMYQLILPELTKRKEKKYLSETEEWLNWFKAHLPSFYHDFSSSDYLFTSWVTEYHHQNVFSKRTHWYDSRNFWWTNITFPFFSIILLILNVHTAPKNTVY